MSETPRRRDGLPAKGDWVAVDMQVVAALGRGLYLVRPQSWAAGSAATVVDLLDIEDNSHLTRARARKTAP